MLRTSFAVVLLIMGIGWAGMACDGETNGSGGSAGTSSQSSTTSSTTSTASAGGGGTGGSAGMGGGGNGGTGGTGGGGGPASGICAKACTMPVDCCFGNPNCPGPYPANPTCENGICKGGECMGNQDCIGPNDQCKLLTTGASHCITVCMNDAQCPVPSKCTGISMDGTMYCKVDLPPFMCVPGEVCNNGVGICNATGDDCECFSDLDCTMFFNKCVMP